MEKRSLAPPSNSCLRIKIQPDQDGQRLDRCLALHYPEVSRTQIQSWITHGHVRDLASESSHHLKTSTRVKADQIFEIQPPSPVPLDLTPVNLDLNILFEDDDLAVVFKPSGLSVHPSHTENGPTLVHGLLHALRSLSSLGGVMRPGIVHRIDKGTSGLLVVTKNDRTHALLADQFKSHKIHRIYRSICWGTPHLQGSIETFLARHPTQRLKFTGKLKSGKFSKTHWKTLNQTKPFSLLELKLETGRTHQIRVHLSESGWPVVGDPLYGKDRDFCKKNPSLSQEIQNQVLSLNHQMLHAQELGFIHPRTLKNLHFAIEPPTDFLQLQELLWPLK